MQSKKAFFISKISKDSVHKSIVQQTPTSNMPNLTQTALTPRSALGGEVGGRPRNLIAEPPLRREQLLPGQQAPAATPLLRHPPPPRHLAGQLFQPHPLQRLHARDG